MNHILQNRLNIQTIFFTGFAALLVLSVAPVTTFSQTIAGTTKNNPYFPSPSTKAQKVDAPHVPATPPAQVSISTVAHRDADIEIRPTVDHRNYKPVKNVEIPTSSPVNIYKIGVGDIIYVNLKNAPNSSGYYMVKANGMIDFPLAGDKLVVTDRTANEIAEMLAAGITLYSDPQVEVKVRDYRSHKINVSGMVEQPGESSIQREAIPLYVVCAQAGVDPKATKALVRRSDRAQVETFDLRDAGSDKILIYPGNSIEFTDDSRTATVVTHGYYYIAGSVNSTGQKGFFTGMTLSQAIAASGGTKGNPKKAMIRRKSDKGILTVSEYDLHLVKDRKNIDPTLAPGDMIEIIN